MYEIFSNLLQRYNMTPYKLSKEIGISQSTLSDWKRGVSTPKQDKLKKIAEYFNVSLEYLMTGKEKEDGGIYSPSDKVLEMAQEIMADENMMRLVEFAKQASPETIKALTELMVRMREDGLESLAKKQDDESIYVNAAHRRTDIEVTDEMRQHDDSIMMDDEEWK